MALGFCVVCSLESEALDDAAVCPGCRGDDVAAPAAGPGAGPAPGRVTERFCVACGLPFAAADDAGVCPVCSGAGPRAPATVLAPSSPPTAGASTPPPRPATLAPEPTPTRLFPTAAEVPGTWEPGDLLLDLYEVRGELGHGGMGTVYRVHHRGWNLDLAVKSPLPGVEGFAAEAEAWVELGLHPHIVTCHYVRVLGGIPRVFAELVEGGSLEDWIEDGRLYAGTPSEALARLLDVALQFAWGLGYAHERGLVHQDVKPANVLLSPDGTAKVTDFGLATARPQVAAAGGRGDSVLVAGAGGTPAYFSPEQADALEQARAGTPPGARGALTRRTDVWSYGVSVLEMFTGERTWQHGVAAAGVLEAYLADGPGRPGPPPMPAGLAKLLRRCLATDPADRPRDFDEVADALAAAYRESTGTAYPRTRPAASELLAPSLTNKAVSLIELALVEQPDAALRHAQDADAALRGAQEADPDLPEVVYNKALVDWHAARITDLQAADRMRACVAGRPGEWRPAQLAAMLHMERCDRPAALEVLRSFSPAAGDRDELEQLISEIEGSSVGWAGLTASVDDRAEPLSCVAFTPDGQSVVTCGGDRRALMGERGNGVVQVIDGRTAKVKVRTPVPGGSLREVVLAPGAQTAFATSLDGVVVELQVGRGVPVWSAQVPGKTLTDLAISPDGRYLLANASPSSYIGGGQVVVWNLRTREIETTLSEKGQLLDGLAIHQGRVYAGGSAWSGRGSFVIHVWELATRKEIRCIETRSSGAVACLAVDATRALLVSGHANGELMLWSLDRGDRVRSLEGHIESVHSVAVHPHEPYVISASEDRTVRVWDITSGVCLRTLEGHEDGLRGLSLTADGRRLATGSRDGDVRIWDLSELPGAPRRWAICGISTAEGATDTRSRFTALRTQVREALAAQGWARAGRLAAEARSLPGMERHQDALALWRDVTRHGRPGGLRAVWSMVDLPGHAESITSVAIDPGGGLAVSGSADATVRVWDLRLRELRRTLEGHTKAVTAVALHPDGERLLSGSADGSIRMWDLGDGASRVVHEGRRGIDVLVVTPDGRYVVAADNGVLRGPTLRVCDLAGNGSFTLGPHKRSASVTCLAASPDGRHVLCGEIDAKGAGAGFDLSGILRLWDLDAKRAVIEFTAHDYPPVSAAVGRDGRHAVTTCWNRDLATWDLGASVVHSVVEGQRGGQPNLFEFRAIALRGDGRVALNGGDDGKLRLWDLQRGALLREFEAHAGDARACAITPDGSVGVSGGEDGKLRVWGFDWEFEFPDAVDVDRMAVLYLEVLAAQRARSRDGSGGWSEEDVDWLCDRLGECGYGWMRRDGVRAWLQRGRR